MQLHQVVVAADMAVVDENLRNAAAPAAARQHGIERGTVTIDAHFLVVESTPNQKILRGNAVRAGSG